MVVTFDPAKNADNIAKRGLSFELVDALDWNTAILKVDDRKDYGETRIRVLALLDGKLHAAVVTPRGDELTVISFRKASRTERKIYGRED